MKILIVEDEPIAQQELTRLLTKIDKNIEVIGYIDSVEDGVEWFETNSAPDLVFLDIQLSDGLSFQIFDQVKVEAPVIFTTAFNEYALEAFKLNSIDYLLKPIEPSKLAQALAKFDSLKSRYSTGELEKSMEKVREMLTKGNENYKKRFLSKVGDQYLKIEVEDVAYFQADNNIVYLITKNGGKHIIEYTIEELNNLVDPRHFFRLNRTFLCAVDSISKVHKYFNSRLKIDLKPEISEKVLVSRARVSEFLKWMDN